MTILTIDIGNTAVKVAVVEAAGESVRFLEKKTFPSAEPPERELRKLALTEFPLEGAVLSSVVPALTEGWSAWAKSQVGQTPVQVSSSLNLPMTFAIPEPERLGADRIADAAFAAAKGYAPCVTVDCGTCTTFNVLGTGTDGRPVFLGGAIAPGMNTQIQSLTSRGAQLPDLPLEAPGVIIGTNTKECMQTGVVLGTASMVDGMVARYESELGEPLTLLLTGGNAPLILPHLNHPAVFEENLLEKGLAVLYEWNESPGEA